MRYPAAEKLEILRPVEQSPLPVRRALERLGIPRATFYHWYEQYQSGGPEALEDKPRGQAGSGTASSTRSAGRSSSWPWLRRSCRRAN